MTTAQERTSHDFDTPASSPGAPKSPTVPPPSPGDRPYSVRHHGKKVDRMSAVFSKTHSVPRLLSEPPSPRGKGEVGEIDTKHIRRVKDLAGRVFAKSHSLPKCFDSPHSYRAKVDVGEIDTEHIRHVKDLANEINRCPEKEIDDANEEETRQTTVRKSGNENIA